MLQGALLQQMASRGQKPALDEPGFEAMCGVKAQSMVKFLEWMDEKWGASGGSGSGLEGYLKEELGLGEEDFESIRRKLLG